MIVYSRYQFTQAYDYFGECARTRTTQQPIIVQDNVASICIFLCSQCSEVEEQVEAQERSKGRPKGAMSAYACFVQVIRGEHKKKYPDEQIIFTA